MKDFAKHILYVANKEKRLTNLELQMIMYFSIGEYIYENGIDKFITILYNIPFESTFHGPLIRNIHLEYKRYGRNKIKDSGIYKKEYEVLNKFIRSNIERNAFDMIRDSQKRVTWKRYKSTVGRGKKRVFYNLEDIKADFHGN